MREIPSTKEGIKNTTAYKWAKKEKGKHFCQCGCNRVIRITWHHYFEGIPKYINHHNGFTQNPLSIQLGRGKTAKLSRVGFSYNYIYQKNGKQTRINLGSDIKLARRAIQVFYRTKRKEVIAKNILNLIDTIKTQLERQFSELENVRVDKSLQEARQSLADLRKLLKEKTKEINYGN